MAFLLAFGGVSKEYLHLFTGHTDTQSCNHYREGLYFESEHHHCDFLSYTLPYYVPAAVVSISFSVTGFYPEYNLGNQEHISPCDVPAFHLRGPPILPA